MTPRKDDPGSRGCGLPRAPLRVRREHPAHRQRGTSLTGGRPTALLAAYYDEHDFPARGQHWRELRLEIASDIDRPDRLKEVGEDLRFLRPVCDSLIQENPFTQAWPAGGPWRPEIQAPTGGKGGE